MTLYDIIIIVTLGLFIIGGFIRGFICELFEVIGILLGIWAGRQFAPAVSQMLPNSISGNVKFPLAALAIGIIVFLLVKLIGWLIAKIIVHGPLKILNRLGGAFVGIIKGGLIIAFALLLIAMTPHYKKIDRIRPQSPVLNLTVKLSQPIIRYYHKYLIKPSVSHITKSLPKDKKEAIRSSLIARNPAFSSYTQSEIDSIIRTGAIEDLFSQYPDIVSLDVDELARRLDAFLKEKSGR